MKTTNLKEWEMRPAAAAWLVSRGLIPVCEVATRHLCDYVGLAWEERVGRKRPKLLRVECVELKLEDFAGVLSQAVANLDHCNASWIMMPSERIEKFTPATFGKLQAAGIGLLAFHDGEVVEMSAPTIEGTGWRHNSLNLWRRSQTPDDRHTKGMGRRWCNVCRGIGSISGYDKPKLLGGELITVECEACKGAGFTQKISRFTASQ